MEEKIIKLKITDNAKDVEKNVHGIKEEFDAVDKSIKKVDSDLKNVENSSKEAANSIAKIGQGVRSISSNVKTIGLGLLVTQFDDFKGALASSSVATDFFNTSLNVTKKGAKDLIDVISSGNILDALKGGVKSIFDGTAVSKIKAYGKESIDAAKNVTDLVNKAAVASVKQQGIFEQYDRQAEQQRMIRDNQLLDMETRMKASEALKVILKKQTSEMLSQARIQKQAADALYGISGSREDYLKSLEAENNILGVKAQIQGFLTEQSQAQIGLITEQRQNQEASTRTAIDLEYQKQDVANQTLLYEYDRLKANKQLLKEKLTDEAQYWQMIGSQYEEGSTKKIEIENNAATALQAIRDQQKLNDYNLMLEEKRIDEARLQNKLAYVAQVGAAVGAIGQLFEQGTDAAKAAALAEIAINTGLGFVQGLDIAQKSAKATGPAAAFAFPIFYATQVAAVLGAASRAKSILESGNTGGGGVSESAPTINAPRFNVVGVSPINQAAQAMQNSANQPVKAYVVSKDVTTAQALDRNKIETVGL